MSKFDELKTLAEAATIGNWSACGPSFGAALPKYCDEVVSDASESGEEVTICTGPHWDKEYWPERSINMQFIAAANPATILELLAIQAQLVEALANIAQPANAGCGCHFPCRCDSEGAEAISAVSMRSEAQEALVAYYAAAKAQP